MMARRSTERLVHAAVAAVAVAVGFFATGLGPHLEHWSTDLQIAYLSQRPAAQYPKLALVTVSDETLKDYPYTQPVDRKLLADLVSRLDQAGAGVIGLDFVFDRATEPEKDKRLIDAIRGAKTKIVLGALDVRTPTPERNTSFQSEFLAAAGRPVGHLYFEENHNPLLLNNRVVRLFAGPADNSAHRSGFAEVLAREQGQASERRTRYISWLLPPDNQSETFLTLPAELVLSDEAKLPLAELLANKVVIVGGAFADRDRHLTPLSVLNQERASGVVIHAQMVAQLLDRRSIGALSRPLELALLAIAACAGFWLGRRERLRHYGLWLRSVGAVGLTAVGALVFASFGVIFPITLTLLFLLAGTAFGYHSKRIL